MTDPLSILYHDDDVVVVDKPANLLVHRTDLVDDPNAALQRTRDQIGQWLYPVHRLDRPTSGALVFARRPGAANQLAADFRGGSIAKSYLAVVRGWPPEHGVIHRPLKPGKGKPPRSSRSRFVRLATTELPFAVSRFPTTRYALILAAPDSGRFHQVRRHLKGISHPIIGDTAHGDRHHNRFFREHLGTRRLLLHAWWLGFRQPSTGERIVVRAPPPVAFGELAETFGWTLDEATLEAARAELPAAGAASVG